MTFLEELFALEDKDYKAFDQKLVPTIAEERIIGVRVPQIRALAKNLYRSQHKEAILFLDSLPHYYVEEDHLHALLIHEMTEVEQVLRLTEAFLPHIDNWKTCDIFSPPQFKSEPNRLLPYIDKWLASNHTYTARFAIRMLMVHFLDERFQPAYLDTISAIRTEAYYLKMMVAWYISVALVKQYDMAVRVLEECRLDSWTHQKAIQKAVESRRINEDKKRYLRSLKMKNKKEGNGAKRKA